MQDFTGWPADGPALLSEIAVDNTAEFWAAHRDRHAAAVLAPTRALAAALEPEFGPVRVFRPQRNRRFRPGAPPYRTDTGGLARSPGGCGLEVVLSGSALTVTAGHRSFDGGQLRRYRSAVSAELEEILAGLPGLALDAGHALVGTPRGYAADHPRIGLLRLLRLQVTRSWPVGPWLATAEPLDRVRDAWRAAAPLTGWLDAHVGPPAPVAPRPRRALAPDPDPVRPGPGSAAADRIAARAARHSRS